MLCVLSLSQNDMTVEAAAAFLQQFNKIFPGIQPALLRLKEQVGQFGYVSTLFARRRPLMLLSGNEAARARARRQVPNTLCQGSAADIVKAVMHRVLLEIHRREPQPLHRETARLVMQLHDELVFEVRQERLQHVAQLIVQQMELEHHSQKQQFHLRVPLEVRTKIGVSWGQLHEWTCTNPLSV